MPCLTSLLKQTGIILRPLRWWRVWRRSSSLQMTIRHDSTLMSRLPESTNVGAILFYLYFRVRRNLQPISHTQRTNPRYWLSAICLASCLRIRIIRHGRERFFGGRTCMCLLSLSSIRSTVGEHHIRKWRDRWTWEEAQALVTVEVGSQSVGFKFYHASQWGRRRCMFWQPFHILIEQWTFVTSEIQSDCSKTWAVEGNLYTR